jgi:hypothetical protein
MTKRILFLSLISLALASAADKADKFGVNLYQATVVNGTTFKAGDAKIEITGGKALLKQGKLAVEVPVTVELAKDKYPDTRVGYRADQIRDICVGGTNKHILFTETAGGQ